MINLKQFNELNAITSDDVLGKEVIDMNGEFLGVVETLFIHPQNIEVIGIQIDKGFLRRGLLIGKDHIEKVTPHAVFLKIKPAVSVKGMKVFDSDGKDIGTVMGLSVKQGTNEIDNLAVSSPFFKKKVNIAGDLIKFIGYNVFLTDKRENLKLPD
ncbi:PRC-barrel domain-containing protein [Candidatus Pacearchaeota archaeon]|nr:PRC-barrel domain-containing protein [Candidatus Pacearchaeota archaeon]